jgi:hypothetical protein
MLKILNYPFMVFALSLTVLWASTILGARLAPRVAKDREDLNVVVAATLTLLGLILAFTFSMAVHRYDQRKLYEEEEANAIGTEYVRGDLLPPADGETVQKLLRDYLDQRILFYRTRDEAALKRIDAATGQLQQQLWAAVRGPARAQQTTVMALVVAGMNDVLNSQGYTQASWLNRIPVAAWLLLVTIAICANILVGLSWHRLRSTGLLLGMLPLIVSAALKLIADIDSPRGGLIHVEPVNLITLATSLRP